MQRWLSVVTGLVVASALGCGVEPRARSEARALPIVEARDRQGHPVDIPTDADHTCSVTPSLAERLRGCERPERLHSRATESRAAFPTGSWWAITTSTRKLTRSGQPPSTSGSARVAFAAALTTAGTSAPTTTTRTSPSGEVSKSPGLAPRVRRAAKGRIFDWARSVMRAHPSHRVIGGAHYLIDAEARWAEQGQRVYEALREEPNLTLMLCGHMVTEARRSDPKVNCVVHTLLSDYQSRQNGGDGWLRLLRFFPNQRKVAIFTYSPSLMAWEVDESSRFDLEL